MGSYTQESKNKGPVVRTPVTANSGLNFNTRFFLEYPIIKLQAKTIKLILLFKFPCLRSNFPVTLGYLEPDPKNPA